MAKGQARAGPGFEEALGIGVGRIQLRMLVAQDLLAIDSVDDLVMAVHLCFERHPLVERIQPSLRLDDVRLGQCAFDLDVRLATRTLFCAAFARIRNA